MSRPTVTRKDGDADRGTLAIKRSLSIASGVPGVPIDRALISGIKPRVFPHRFGAPLQSVRKRCADQMGFPVSEQRLRG